MLNVMYKINLNPVEWNTCTCTSMVSLKITQVNKMC